MKTVIFGVREVSPYAKADKEHKRGLTLPEIAWVISNLDYYHKLYPITEVVSGMAYGIDFIGAEWGKARNIPVKEFPYLKELGKAGGMVRNEQMALYCDRGIGFWDGFSTGTKHMISCLEGLRKPHTIWRLTYAPPQGQKPSALSNT